MLNIKLLTQGEQSVEGGQQHGWISNCLALARGREEEEELTPHLQLLDPLYLLIRESQTHCRGI